MMAESMSMFRTQCYENCDCVKDVLTCTHTHTMNEWMKLIYVNGGF